MDGHEIASGLLGGIPTIIFMVIVVIGLFTYLVDKLRNHDD